LVTTCSSSVLFPDVCYSYLLDTGIYLLEDGISLLISVLVGCTSTVS
jgi:hypothetical protein